MISGGIEVNKFAHIGLILEEKIEDDSSTIEDYPSCHQTAFSKLVVPKTFYKKFLAKQLP